MNGLEVRDLRSTASPKVLESIDFAAKTGSITALIGPNGAGKTTLLTALARKARAHTGSIVFAGVNQKTSSRRAWAQRVAFVEQESSIEVALTGWELVALGRIPHADGVMGSLVDEAIEYALERAGALPFAHRNIATLSGGERQRLSMARAIAQQPSLLLCDEPANHLDVRAQLEMYSLLRDLASGGVTIVVSLHDLNQCLSIADNVIVLANGSVRAQGASRRTLTTELVQDVWGVSAALVATPNDGRAFVVSLTP